MSICRNWPPSESGGDDPGSIGNRVRAEADIGAAGGDRRGGSEAVQRSGDGSGAGYGVDASAECAAVRGAVFCAVRWEGVVAAAGSWGAAVYR